MSEALLTLLAEDKLTIAYRPRLTELTDSALAAILLQQIIYLWNGKNSNPFYKFKEPCKHEKYRDGDSWCETLGWNAYEFETALKTIGTKITKGVSRKDALATEMPEQKTDETMQAYYDRFAAALKCIVLYWTDGDRVTWYEVNTALLGKLVGRVYIDKLYGLRYIKKSILAVRNKNSWIGRRYITETTAETSTETTSEKKDIAPQNGAVKNSPIDTAPPTLPALTGLLEKPSDALQPQSPANAQTKEPPVSAHPPQSKAKHEKKSKPDADPETSAAIAALIAAWLKAQPHIVPSQSHYSNRTNRARALDLHKAGVKPIDLNQYIVETQSENPWWKTHLMDWGYILKHIGAWKVDWDAYCQLPYLVPAKPLTPEDHERIAKMFPPIKEVEPHKFDIPPGLSQAEAVKWVRDEVLRHLTRNQTPEERNHDAA